MNKLLSLISIAISINFICTPLAFAKQITAKRSKINEFHCLISTNGSKTIKLQFNINGGFGTVRYQDQKSSTPIKLESTSLLDTSTGGSVATLTKWKALSSGAKNGVYFMTSKGTLVQAFKYVNTEGKIITFDVSLDAVTAKGCLWEKPIPKTLGTDDADTTAPQNTATIKAIIQKPTTPGRIKHLYKPHDSIR